MRMPSHWLWMTLVAIALSGCDGGDRAASETRFGGGGQSQAAGAGFEVAAIDPSLDAELELDSGRQLFLATCAACHGASGQGMPNQGPDLRPSQFIARTPDADLVAFIAKGRTPGEPGSTTGLPMPPRGGNAALSDRDLGLVVKYMRTLLTQDEGGGNADIALGRPAR